MVSFSSAIENVKCENIEIVFVFADTPDVGRSVWEKEVGPSMIIEYDVYIEITEIKRAKFKWRKIFEN